MPLELGPPGHNPITVQLHHLSQHPARLSQWSRCLEAPRRTGRPTVDEQSASRGASWWHSLQAESTRRALLLTALGGLLIAGHHHRAPRGAGPPAGLGQHDMPSAAARQRGVRPGAGRRLPELAGHGAGCGHHRRLQGRPPLRGRRVGRHAHVPRQRIRTRTPRRRRRRASSRSARSSARPPSSSYLGAKFDPNSRFTVSMLWSGDRAWRQSGERRMLCGLQLPGAEQPAAGVQGQGRRRRPVQGVAGGHLPGHRPDHQPADRHPDRLRGAARDGGDAARSTWPRSSPAGLPPEPEQDALHQGRVHADDGRVPGARSSCAAPR